MKVETGMDILKRAFPGYTDKQYKEAVYSILCEVRSEELKQARQPWLAGDFLW
jgi:hypothetical protein